MSLERFHEAQNRGWAGYGTALREIRRGRKNSHWIWYIFPQLEGLGHSAIAREYALRDLRECCAYLRDPVLRARYEQIASAVSEQLAGGVALEELMGGRTDALKLVSSVTLFRAAAQRLDAEDPTLESLRQPCGSILRRATEENYASCQFTLARIVHEPPPP